MTSSIRHKLRSETGETLVESMASMLVASMAIIMLVGAIATSARVNHEADETRSMASALPANYTPSVVNVAITYDPGASDAGAGASTDVSSAAVNLYDADGLYYYEPKSEGAGA